MSEPIRSFTGEFAFLANSYKCKIKYDWLTFESVEDALASSMLMSRINKVVMTKIQGPADFVRTVPEEFKITCNLVKDCREFLRQKFHEKSELAAKLEATANRELLNFVDGDDILSITFGINKATGQGENHLGRLLMELRFLNRQKVKPCTITLSNT